MGAVRYDKEVLRTRDRAPADWGAVLRAGPALLSFPVTIAGSVRASDLGPFLEGGGWVAWGAVPTDGPVGDSSWPRRSSRAARCSSTKTAR